MTDYDPRIDKPAAYDDAVFEPRQPSRGLYLVVGVVAAIVAAVGIMMFANDASRQSDIAKAPDEVTRAQTEGTRTPAIPPREAPAVPTPGPADRAP